MAVCSVPGSGNGGGGSCIYPPHNNEFLWFRDPAATVISRPTTKLVFRPRRFRFDYAYLTKTNTLVNPGFFSPPPSPLVQIYPSQKKDKCTQTMSNILSNSRSPIIMYNMCSYHLFGVRLYFSLYCHSLFSSIGYILI